MMGKIYIIFFAIIFQFCHSSQTQVMQEWAARYAYISLDIAVDVVVDISGNVYVTGYSNAPNGYKDYATVKYNSSGIEQWVQRYNGPGNHTDESRAITLDDSGNVYVTGVSNRFGFNQQADYDIATIKYNTNGVQQWLRRYDGGSDENTSAGIVMDKQKNIYIGGRKASTGYLIIKYNSNGDTLWVRTYSNDGTGARAIAVDSTGNVYLTGRNSAQDWLTVKWNSQGVFQWARTFNGPGNGSDYPQAIAVSDSGNVYVTGYVWGNNNTDYATVKYNTDGAQQWVAYYNGGSVFTAGDGAFSIALDDIENVYVTGSSTNPNAPTPDYATIKYSSGGVQQWVTRFNGPSNSYDEPCCIKLDTAGNVYITGFSTISPPINRDYCTIKYNNSGQQQWVMYYTSSNPNNPIDEAYALAVDRQFNVYVTGGSMGDYATIKYSQTTGIVQISNETPKEFKLYQNYPNPFNPTTKIRFAIPTNVKSETSNVMLIIYDILGREVAILVNEQLNPGTYEVEFDAANFTSGIYFFRLNTSNFTETKKMIIIK